MKKKVLLYVILVLAVIGAATYGIYYFGDTNVYKGTALVVEAPSYKKVVAEIKDDENVFIGKADINASVFGIGDKVNIEYVKRGNSYKITKIEAIALTTEDKLKLISSIRKNVVPLRDYREMINVVSAADNSELMVEEDGIYPMYAIPEKLSNQVYDMKVTPIEFYQVMHDVHGINPTIEEDVDALVLFEKDAEFKILNFDSINENDAKEKIDYELKDNSLSFKTVELGRIYNLRVEFKNGDIINYIFG